MNYNDESLLNDYQKMAEAYKQKQSDFVFVSLDNSKEEAYLHETMQLLYFLKGSLFALGGFLGTGAMYNLNEKHIAKMQALFDKNFDFRPQHFSRDKTKTFLNTLSLESALIGKLLSLAEHSDYSKQIFEIIKERTHLLSSLLKVNSVIS